MTADGIQEQYLYNVSMFYSMVWISTYPFSIDLRSMYLYQDSQILKAGVFMRWFNPNQSLENRFSTKTYICNDPIQPTYMWVAILISDQEKTDKREIIFPIIILQTVAYWRMLQCRIYNQIGFMRQTSYSRIVRHTQQGLCFTIGY